MGHGIIKHKNMKFIALAALALLGQVSAVRFPSSEGPTKVDLGEDDPKVVGRADDDPEATKWHKRTHSAGPMMAMMTESYSPWSTAPLKESLLTSTIKRTTTFKRLASSSR